MTMTNSENDDAADEKRRTDFFAPLFQYQRAIWQGTIAIGVFAALIGGVTWALQPTSLSASVGFRPTFDGADIGKYPNSLSFGPADIIAPSVLTQVFERNEIQAHCSLEAFRAGLVVHETSEALQFLLLEYVARLADTRLTSVDRQRLQEEFMARRASLPSDYELQFVRPRPCASLPEAVVLKSLPEVLETWASESQERRGVTKSRVVVLSPKIFDSIGADSESTFVRADLVRSAVVRVIANIKEVEMRPGSELVRPGPEGMSFAEVRLRLADLVQARLDQLVASAGRLEGRESTQWVVRALRNASAEVELWQGRADSYRRALSEYSGMLVASRASLGDSGSKQSSDVQALTPQIDRTFIEGIVALSETNTRFRQEITRSVIEASLEASVRSESVAHYQALQSAIDNAHILPRQEINARLAAQTAEARELTAAFNATYAEYSRVAYRAGSSMYRVDRPAHVVMLRAFSLRNYVGLVVGLTLASPIVLAMICLILVHTRRFARTLATSN